MKKQILNLGKALDKAEQKQINGGNFPFLGDCCACVFTPAGSMFPIFITQSCSIPCPQDGDLEYQDTGC